MKQDPDYIFLRFLIPKHLPIHQGPTTNKAHLKRTPFTGMYLPGIPGTYRTQTHPNPHNTGTSGTAPNTPCMEQNSGDSSGPSSALSITETNQHVLDA